MTVREFIRNNLPIIGLARFCDQHRLDWRNARDQVRKLERSGVVTVRRLPVKHQPLEIKETSCENSSRSS
jgi:hypothetical protein